MRSQRPKQRLCAAPEAGADDRGRRPVRRRRHDSLRVGLVRWSLHTIFEGHELAASSERAIGWPPNHPSVPAFFRRSLPAAGSKLKIQNSKFGKASSHAVPDEPKLSTFNSIDRFWEPRRHRVRGVGHRGSSPGLCRKPDCVAVRKSVRIM